jgi:hypothetical protein
VLPPAAAASSSAAVTSNAPRGPPPESRAARTPIGSPSRAASRGLGAAGAGALACFVAATFAAACFAFAFRAGAGFAFGSGFGAARGMRGGVTAVVTGRDAEVVLAAREVSGAGAAGAVLVTGRFGVVATVEAATAGASGVGTACADSDARFAGRDAGAAAAFTFDGFEVEDVAKPPGGSSGAGIGVPPAAQPTAGHANATMQTPAATESRLSRRDDVHLDTHVPPFGASRYVG